MSRNKIATKATAEDLSGVTITFDNNTSLTVRLADLTDEMTQQLALHGLSQKLGDSYSGESDITVAIGKAQAVADRLKNGDWRAVSASGGGGRISDLAQAFSNVTGKTLEEAVTAIEMLDKAQKAELRKHPAINTETKRIALARAEAALDGTSQADLASLLS